MSKYDFSLDLETQNSLSVILKHINPKSRILEVGCAHGRMTRYMKEQLNCDITIIEKDQEAGNIAKQWAARAYLGEHLGDVEKILCEFREPFDYIIFADVLEHLYDPENVLQESKKLLGKNGSIWISIPNIGHNAILIDLWNGKFTYRDIGLLDRTHIRFFTQTSLMEMVRRIDLKPKRQYNLINRVPNTEIGNLYEDVPEVVALELKKRPNGEVYQFVWELKH